MSDAPLLMIPGPLEFEPAVLDAMHASKSHVAPDVIEAFGASVEALREVFLAPDGQPLVLSGSGSLGWDVVAANFVQPGAKALVINTGYFGDSFGDCLEAYGVQVTHLRCAIGSRPSAAELEAALRAGGDFALVTVTHVDTSTGVLTDLKEVAEVVRRVQPGALIAVDGVCATGGEEMRMTEWDLDLALTGSQKALGVPPGLALVMVRPRAQAAFEAREAPVGAYYASYARWLPVMKKYEAREPSYFATPAVNHVLALHVSLSSVIDPAKGGIEGFFARHRAVALGFKAALAHMGVSQVPAEGCSAHTLTCGRYPAGVTGAQLLPALKRHGVIAAGGLHKEIKAEYFRVGHMAMRTTASLDLVERTVRALAKALKDCGHDADEAGAVAALQAKASELGYSPVA